MPFRSPSDFPKMVGWYSPKLLLKAAVEVVVSTLFGQHADQRTVQALVGRARIYDYSDGERKDSEISPDIVFGMTRSRDEATESKDIWFDYIADLGDGWDSTYSVAYLATRPKLMVETSDGATSVETQRGRILIFGGDQVYPTATRDDYNRRFLGVYEAAMADGQERENTDVFAIPGNHDWYDSLRSFSRIFFTDDGFVNVERSDTATPQTRSYFAIKLPQQWWLLATDVQLGSDIDANQLEYFRTVASQFQEGDKVILCTAEPHWVTAKKAEKRESIASPSALDRLEQELLGSRVRVFVAGDVHHYMRFESQPDVATSKVHKITAGGGGAFLHPTHRTWDRKLLEPTINGQSQANEFTRPDGAVFPSVAQSWKLSLRNGFFGILNPRFGIVTALMYVVFALMMMPAFIRYENKIAAFEEKALETRKEAVEQKMFEQMQAFMDGTAPSLAAADQPGSTTANEESSPEITRFWPYFSLESVKNDVRLQSAIEQLSQRHQQADSGASQTIEATGVDERYAQIGSLKKMLDETKIALQVAGKGDFVSKMGRAYRRSNIKLEPNMDSRPEIQIVIDNLVREKELQTSREPLSSLDPSDDVFETSIELDEADGESHVEFEEVPSPSEPFAYLFAITKQELALPDPFQSMLAILVFVSVVGGFVMFTDIPNPFLRLLMGSCHGLAHWFAAYLVTLSAGPLMDAYWPLMDAHPWRTCGVVGLCILPVTLAYGVTADKPGKGLFFRSMPAALLFGSLVSLLLFLVFFRSFQPLAVVLIVFMAGWLIGSILMGAYLFIAHTLTGQHWNESFSSIRCKDWKCFLRFRLTANGDLTIYPIGIPKACRKWTQKELHVHPTNNDDLAPILIEPPIQLS